MNQIEAFLIALALLLAGTYVARKYLSNNARVALAIVAAAFHLA